MGLNVKLDPEETEKVLTGWIRDYCTDAGVENLVVGMSGGIDSAVVATLGARALGADHVHGFFLPSYVSTDEEREHAGLAAAHAGIELHVYTIADMVKETVRQLEADTGRETPRDVKANIMARCRMVLLYAEAQMRGALVLGTGNKSELLTGYFTKYGDGGTDLVPIGDLYKTQVRAFAAHLGIPGPIIEKPPTAGLWGGQTDEKELGMTYDTLDQILLGIEVGLEPRRIAEDAGVDLSEVVRIENMRRATQHKRAPSLIPKLGIRSLGTDWRDPVLDRPLRE